MDSHDEYLWGTGLARPRHPPRRQLRQVPLVPEHHRPAVRRHGREPPAAPVRGDGRAADQDPDRDHAHRAARVRALGGGLHRPHLPQGLGQRRFFSANSAQKPKIFGQSDGGKAAETNYRLGTQLPYMFIMTRLAHYIKVLQREQIGSWKERADLERELNVWINQYVADMEDPSPSVRSCRPLRKAKITVSDVEGSRAGTGATSRCGRTSSTWVRPSRSRWSASSTRSSVMAQTVHLFLKANGKDIKGESTQPSMGRADSIECVSFELGGDQRPGVGFQPGHRPASARADHHPQAHRQGLAAPGEGAGAERGRRGDLQVLPTQSRRRRDHRAVLHRGRSRAAACSARS